MITIYKYYIGRGVAELPKGYQILSVGIRNLEFYVWAKVDSSVREFELVKFGIYGTGWDMDEQKITDVFLGTVHCKDFVWHVFKE